MKHLWILPLLLLVTHARSAPRSSMSYTISADTLSSAGGHATSTSYSGDGSLGGISGIATAAAPAETLKGGYIGQLTEVTALKIAATSTTLNEGTTLPLTATATLDDATTSVLIWSDLIWITLSNGALSVNSDGLATAGNVYQTSVLPVIGWYYGVNNTLNLTVVNTGTDDFGIYSADGIPDTWQVQYFGLDNPLAAASADPSGTGQTNLFKYTSGLDPTDHHARFLTGVGSSGNGRTLTLSPRLPDRTYTVQYSTDLTHWQPLTGAIIEDNGQTRTVTDPDTISPLKFYRVQVSYP